MPRVAKAIIAAAIAALALPAAQADVRSVTLDAVYDRAECSADGCTGSKGRLDEGAMVGGAIQVKLSAEADIALNFVRLEARPVGQEVWFCVQRWEPTGAGVQASYDWDTASWPPPSDPDWNCTDTGDPNHGHGEPTGNGAYEMRVLARDISGDERTSGVFSLRFNNAPDETLWRKGATLGEEDGVPAVSLSWYGTSDRFVVAYVIERGGPDGTSTIAIDAADPARQGCGVDGRTKEILCVDTGFRAEGSGGEYTYRIVTQKPSIRGGVRCAVGDGRCLVSPRSEERTTKVPGEYFPPPESPGPDRGGKRGRRDDPSDQVGKGSGREGRGGRNTPGGGIVSGQAPPPAAVNAFAAVHADARVRQALIAAAAALLTLAVAWFRRVAAE